MILNRVGNYVGISLICAILTTVVIFFMHRENISRILAGTEPKTTIGGNKNKKNANEEENGDSENGYERRNSENNRAHNEKCRRG